MIFVVCIFFMMERIKFFFHHKKQDEFTKYGKYEIRVRNKILEEKSYINRAKVKWYNSIGSFAYPHLWKENKSDSEYKESWNNRPIPRAKKEEVKK